MDIQGEGPPVKWNLTGDPPLHSRTRRGLTKNKLSKTIR